MKPIDWSDDFSVGVGLLDEQHKRLIGMLNKMIKDPTATTGSETVSDVLDSMTRYTQEHFKSEENLMAEHGYPLLEEHKGQHQAFRKKLAKLCMATTEKVDIVPEALLDFLQGWLSRHILNEDMEYKAFFRSKGIT